MSYLVSAKIRASGTAVRAFDAEDAAMQVKALLRRGARSVEITGEGDDTVDGTPAPDRSPDVPRRKATERRPI